MITCSKSNIHETVKIGNNVRIISDDITIGEGTEIGDNTVIIAYEKLVIGKFCKIRSNAQLKARVIEIGDWFYSDDNPRPLVIGGGGSDFPDAIIKIGDRCVIHDSFMNSPVEIGDDVGMSPSSDIITHGFWDSVLDGYSRKQGPVKIGSGTIVGYRALIMPNITIGHHCSIGAGAIVTKDIPDYCVVAGVPAKVIAGPPDYPRKVTLGEKKNMCWQIIMQYIRLLKDKIDNFTVESGPYRDEMSKEYIEIHGEYNGEKFRVGYSDGMIVVEQGKKFIAIDPIFQGWSGEDSEISDDLRDFLRHYGIRIFTNRWFKSIDSKIKWRICT